MKINNAVIISCLRHFSSIPKGWNDYKKQMNIDELKLNKREFKLYFYNNI